MQFWILGNPENRRVTFFTDAVRKAGLAEPLIIPYTSFISNPVFPSHSGSQSVCFRIESPGENADVREALIYRGMDIPGPVHEIHELVNDTGRIGFAKAWYAGFVKTLNDTKTLLAHPGVGCMNHPDDIAVLFDKVKCHERMRMHNVPVPASLPVVHTYEELRAAMRAAGISRVFVKPVHGSSASGVVALRVQGEKVAAISSAEFVRPGCVYNRLRMQVYRDEKTVAALLDTILGGYAVAEQWIPKASINGRSFDFRVLVIGGKATHLVVRTSKSVITNLHLGNRRGDSDEIEAYIGKAIFEKIKTTAEQAAAAFPQSLYIAADVLLANDKKTVSVIETNAFGDLLPGIEYNGQSTYETEIEATKNAAGIS
jgi:glutathione synthase/RimK-type ligase-like ATP-grasp enzyme